MSDTSWILQGLDPETCRQAEAEAERRGIGVADVLAELLLQEPQDEGPPSQTPESAERQPVEVEVEPAFAPRHRIEALERRFGLGLDNLGASIQGLDGAVFDLAARMDGAEHAAHSAAANAAEARAQAMALRERLAHAEATAQTRLETQTRGHEKQHAALSERCGALDGRINGVESLARRADAAAGALSLAHEALKHAIAEDFEAMVAEHEARLEAGLGEARDAARAAAAQAESALLQFGDDLSAVRQRMEQRLTESTTETREGVQAAFADTNERIAAVAARIDSAEGLTLRTAEQLHNEVAEVERYAQAALDETAESLRLEIERAHTSLAAEATQLRERQNTDSAHLKRVDAAASSAAREIAAVREAFEAALDTRLTQAQAAWNARYETLWAQAAKGERDAAQGQHTLHAEAQRIEASTLASLEKLGHDIAGTHAALDAKLANAAENTHLLIEAIQRRLDGELGEIHDHSAGVFARLKLIENELQAGQTLAARVDQIEAAAQAASVERASEAESELQNRQALAARVARLETAANDTSAERAIAAMQEQLATLAQRESRLGAATAAAHEQIAKIAQRVDAPRPADALGPRVQEMQSRLAAYETKAAEAGDRVQEIARVLGQVTSQNAEVSKRSEDRARKAELAIADLRLAQLSRRESVAPAAVAALEARLSEVEASAQQARREAVAAPAVAALDERLSAMETQQAAAFETLQADIARFIADNERRFAELESPTPGPDLVSAFEVLRQRVEERILGVEQRSARTLEQVADAVAVLEERFVDDAPASARQSG